MYGILRLYESVEIAPDSLQFGADGLEAFDDFDVAVGFAAFVALNHVACSLKGHASFFHKVVNKAHLLDVGFCATAEETRVPCGE